MVSGIKRISLAKSPLSEAKARAGTWTGWGNRSKSIQKSNEIGILQKIDVLLYFPHDQMPPDL